MSKEIIQLNEGAIKEELRELVRGSVEETLNSLLEKRRAQSWLPEKHSFTSAITRSCSASVMPSPLGKQTVVLKILSSSYTPSSKEMLCTRPIMPPP